MKIWIWVFAVIAILSLASASSILLAGQPGTVPGPSDLKLAPVTPEGTSFYLRERHYPTEPGPTVAPPLPLDPKGDVVISRTIEESKENNPKNKER